MTDRDRLAADLHETMAQGHDLGDRPDLWLAMADRLIALGWTRNMVADDLAYTAGREDGLREALDEERLARALYHAIRGEDALPLGTTIGASLDWGVEWYGSPNEMAAAIATALREDTDADN